MRSRSNQSSYPDQITPAANSSRATRPTGPVRGAAAASATAMFVRSIAIEFNLLTGDRKVSPQGQGQPSAVGTGVAVNPIRGRPFSCRPGGNEGREEPRQRP